MMTLLLTSAFWIGLLKIIWVNILLSGDNAVVIALAARSLPDEQRHKAVVWGSGAAIAMRVVLTLFAVQLLQLPWLKMLGALLLLWIGIQLLLDDDGEDNVEDAKTPLQAIKIILVADLVMSFDNVLAVAAAAEAAPVEARLPLLVFGLALSIPIVIFGSNLLLKVMDRLPWIITVGAMLIGWIAGEMLAKEPLIAEAVPEAWEILFPSAGALLVIGCAKLLQRLRKTPDQETRPAAQTED